MWSVPGLTVVNCAVHVLRTVAHCGTLPGADCGTLPGADSGALPGADCGTLPGADCGTLPVADCVVLYIVPTANCVNSAICLR
jgi:hypothetical protein